MVPEDDLVHFIAAKHANPTNTLVSQEDTTRKAWRAGSWTHVAAQLQRR